MTPMYRPERKGSYSILQAERAGSSPEPFCVLLLDHRTSALHIRSRNDLESIVGEEDAVIMGAYPEMIEDLARSRGGMGALTLLLDTLSNAVTITDPREINYVEPEEAVDEIFRSVVLRKLPG